MKGTSGLRCTEGIMAATRALHINSLLLAIPDIVRVSNARTVSVLIALRKVSYRATQNHSIRTSEKYVFVTPCLVPLDIATAMNPCQRLILIFAAAPHSRWGTCDLQYCRPDPDWPSGNSACPQGYHKTEMRTRNLPGVEFRARTPSFESIKAFIPTGFRNLAVPTPEAKLLSVQGYTGDSTQEC